MHSVPADPCWVRIVIGSGTTQLTVQQEGRGYSARMVRLHVSLGLQTHGHCSVRASADNINTARQTRHLSPPQFMPRAPRLSEASIYKCVNFRYKAYYLSLPLIERLEFLCGSLLWIDKSKKCFNITETLYFQIDRKKNYCKNHFARLLWCFVNRLFSIHHFT